MKKTKCNRSWYECSQCGRAIPIRHSEAIPRCVNHGWACVGGKWKFLGKGRTPNEAIRNKKADDEAMESLTLLREF